MSASAAFRETTRVGDRARLSLGLSNEAIYEMVAAAIKDRQLSVDVLLDVGCGEGNLRPFVADHCERYVGVDVLRYDGFPADVDFVKTNLDDGRIPLPSGSAGLAIAVETIEHLENPRAFMRELVRVVKPGGWVIVTTPNQLSILSLATLVWKHRFSAFQDIHYPAHLSALLEIDLLRIAAESELKEVFVSYSLVGRVILTPWHYPKSLARLFPRACSDNVLLGGQKPLAIDR